MSNSRDMSCGVTIERDAEDMDLSVFFRLQPDDGGYNIEDIVAYDMNDKPIVLNLIEEEQVHKALIEKVDAGDFV